MKPPGRRPPPARYGIEPEHSTPEWLCSMYSGFHSKATADIPLPRDIESEHAQSGCGADLQNWLETYEYACFQIVHHITAAPSQPNRSKTPCRFGSCNERCACHAAGHFKHPPNGSSSAPRSLRCCLVPAGFGRIGTGIRRRSGGRYLWHVFPSAVALGNAPDSQSL